MEPIRKIVEKIESFDPDKRIGDVIDYLNRAMPDAACCHERRSGPSEVVDLTYMWADNGTGFLVEHITDIYPQRGVHRTFHNIRLMSTDPPGTSHLFCELDGMFNGRELYERQQVGKEAQAVTQEILRVTNTPTSFMSITKYLSQPYAHSSAFLVLPQDLKTDRRVATSFMEEIHMECSLIYSAIRDKGIDFEGPESYKQRHPESAGRCFLDLYKSKCAACGLTTVYSGQELEKMAFDTLWANDGEQDVLGFMGSYEHAVLTVKNAPRIRREVIAKTEMDAYQFLLQQVGEQHQQISKEIDELWKTRNALQAKVYPITQRLFNRSEYLEERDRDQKQLEAYDDQSLKMVEQRNDLDYNAQVCQNRIDALKGYVSPVAQRYASLAGFDQHMSDLDKWLGENREIYGYCSDLVQSQDYQHQDAAMAMK